MGPGRSTSEPIAALAAMPAGITIEEAASDILGRAGTDALVDAPIVAGSRASAATLTDLAGPADRIIVGTAPETDGRHEAPLGPSGVKRLIAAAEGRP